MLEWSKGGNTLACYNGGIGKNGNSYGRKRGWNSGNRDRLQRGDVFMVSEQSKQCVSTVGHCFETAFTFKVFWWQNGL